MYFLHVILIIFIKVSRDQYPWDMHFFEPLTEGEGKMKKKSMIVLLLMVICMITVPSLAQEMEPEAVDEIMGTIRKDDKALNEHDLAAVMETYLPNEAKIVLMGTGPGEVKDG